MNVSIRWLRALAPDLADAPHAVAERLAMLGAPVDAVVDLGGPLRDIVIGRVEEARPHPNADRLTLTKVNAGGELVSVVCGAPNVRAGAYYPFAPVGTTLPGGLQIGRRKIRGEESQGMLCSARELELGRDHEGILELHGTFEPGARFVDAVALDDTRLEVDVTPNRPDLLSHVGIARELAPRGVASLVLPDFPDGAAIADVAFVSARGSAQAGGVTVRIEDEAACPRYIAVMIRGVRVGPSPEWLAARLRAVGQRPINNVVDATNYVLQELGQPLHAFDLGRLGDTVVVRRARASETLVTLDGVERKLDETILAIADAERPVALAGIMGGEATEVTGETTDVLLECALFEPRTVRSGRRALGMSTDASYRFERGVDPTLQRRAAARCAELIRVVAGGAIDEVAVEAAAPEPPAPPVRLRRSRAERVLGEPFTTDAMRALLAPIGFETQSADADALEVIVPGHRRYDVAREDDLVEEVARRHGYDAFPDEVRPFRPSTVPTDPMAELEDRLRTLLVGRGFLEARGAPFVSETGGDVALMLPLASTESHLRRDLLPGLLRRVEANFNRGTRDVRLFEIGTAFAPDGEHARPVETTRLAAVLTGDRAPTHWSGDPGTFDVWDVKAVLEEVAAAVGAVVEPASDGARWSDFDVGAAFEARTGAGRVLGAAGAVRADRIDAPAWAAAVFGLEIILEPAAAEKRIAAFTPLPAFPPIERDLALVAPRSTTAAALEGTIRAAGGPLLVRLVPFDVYEGRGIPEDRRSVAFRLRFRSPERTLTDEEVEPVVAGILERLAREHDVQRR
jgi:phenylalanyl-tRNA synthetase beta chain